jgi:phage/plasmid-like protein (TIGR03299 family)
LGIERDYPLRFKRIKTLAHNLATINGAVAMVYQGGTPWHKLGVRLPSITSVAEALAAANINYTVHEEPLYLANGAVVPTRKAIIRDSPTGPIFLATVGDGYAIIQHTIGFEGLDILCKEFGMTVESAGALGNGERVWILFKMPDVVTPIDGDDVRGYLLATTGHDGSWSYQVRCTPIRVVCQNTLDAASFSGTDIVRLFHTKGNAGKLDDAANVVKAIAQSFRDTGETFASFANRRMSDAEVIRYIETLFPHVDEKKPSDVINARRKTIADLVWTGVGSELARSATDGAANLWATYNAVTEYFDHVRPAEAKSRAGLDRANVSAIFGSGADMKTRAFNLSQKVLAS